MNLITPLVLLALSCLSIAEPVKNIKLQGGSFPSKSIDERITLTELKARNRAERTKEIIRFSKLQLDPENPWRIDGNSGKGPMPEKYYAEQIKAYLEPNPEISVLENLWKPGDAIYHYRTDVREGYVLVRGSKPVYDLLISIR